MVRLFWIEEGNSKRQKEPAWKWEGYYRPLPEFWIDSDCDYSGQCFGKSDRSGYCSCVGGILRKTAAEVCKGISEENTDEETLGIQAGETQMQ